MGSSFIVISILSILFSALIARKVFKAGIESFSSRILIVSAIANTLLWIILFLLQGAFDTYRAISSNSYSPSSLLVPGISLGVAFRVIWNYAAIQRKLMRQFCLEQVEKGILSESVVSLSTRIAVIPPLLMSSSHVKSPFVFGRKSKQAILAIPEDWQAINNPDRYAMLLHELAHIRNHDVGFLAWSQACIKDLRFLVILFPVLFALSTFSSSVNTASFAFVYFVCSIILYVLLRYVVRQRETLADLTAAMLVESEALRDMVSHNEGYTIEPQKESGRESQLLDKLHRWLTDKALFSKSQEFWRFILKLFGFIHTWYPSRSDRLKGINSLNIIQEKSHVLAGESFGAGMLVGLFGVIVGLAAHWLAQYIYVDGSIRLLRLPHKVYGLTAPMIISFLVVFMVLPVWSSLKQETMNKRLLVSLLARHALALLGASLMCPLIFTAGTTIQIRRLFILCLVWCISVSFIGSVANIVGVFLWRPIRYLQSSQVKELKKTIWSFIPLVTLIFILLAVGFSMMRSGRVFDGANILFSVIIGCVSILLLVGKSRFSETEHFLIVRVFHGVYRVEGQRFKLATRLMDSIGCSIILIASGLLTFASIHFIFRNILQDIDLSLCLIVLVVVGGIILIVVDRYESRRIGEPKRLKIYTLCDCLKLLLKSSEIRFREEIRRVADSYDLRRIKDKNVPALYMIVNDVNELVVLISDDPTQDEKRARVAEWILACQRDGGFGLWPGSTARLHSTYQALSILQDLNELDQCKLDSHIQWIRERQQSDGAFKGPWSKRPAWESTFYAVKSLNILESALDPSGAQTCQDWCNNILVNEGIKKNRPDVIYHCFGALDCLGEINADILELVSNWLLSKIDELLLTNVALDYENVHFAVMIYRLLNVRVAIIPKKNQMNLLIQRIQTALDAELIDIPV